MYIYTHENMCLYYIHIDTQVSTEALTTYVDTCKIHPSILPCVHVCTLLCRCTLSCRLLRSLRKQLGRAGGDVSLLV